MDRNGFRFHERTLCPCGTELAAGATSLEKTFSWGNVRFVQCRQCLSWIQSPQITVESLAAWYDSEDYQAAGADKEGAYLDYASEEDQRRREARARYDRDLASILQPGSTVLEVGCASGSLLSVLRDAGHQVFGIDLSVRFAEQARSLYQIPVEAGDFLSFHWTGIRFDLIMMLGTVSNLQHLERHLEHAAKLLKPAGWLYFNLPVADSWVSKLYGQKYWMFAPSVSNFLTRHGIAQALGRVGFRVAKTRRDRQRPTLSKILGHARLQMLYPMVTRIGMGHVSAPFSLPIPGVAVTWAQLDAVG
jgi:SAM-dependent methyltransferase